MKFTIHADRLDASSWRWVLTYPNGRMFDLSDSFAGVIELFGKALAKRVLGLAP